MKKDGETINSLNQEISKNKPSRLEFNGRELSWFEDDKKTNSWKGMSGKPDYQCKEYGSGGCIDLTDKMDEFTDKFKKYGHDMILNVKYDKDCW